MVGVILNLSLWLALRTLFARMDEWRLEPLRLDVPVWASRNLPTLTLTLLAGLALLRFRMGTLPTLGLSTVLGAAYVRLTATR